MVRAEDVDLGPYLPLVGTHRLDSSDTIDAERARRYQCTFTPDDPVVQPGDELPPGYHLLYFAPRPRVEDLRPDGTVRGPSLVPDVDLPRQMFAGETMHLHRPLVVGRAADMTSTLVGLERRESRRGGMVLVTVEHEIRMDGVLAVSSRQRSVFLGDHPEAEGGGRKPRQPVPSSWRRDMVLTDLHLFRFSAITFNAHRIHFDGAWAREQEGFAGPVVQGPLAALLMLDFVRAALPERRPMTFEFRAHSPLTAGTRTTLAASSDENRAHVWIEDGEGRQAMVGTVELAD